MSKIVLIGDGGFSKISVVLQEAENFGLEKMTYEEAEEYCKNCSSTSIVMCILKEPHQGIPVVSICNGLIDKSKKEIPGFCYDYKFAFIDRK